MAISTPLLERRRKISSKDIILRSRALFSNHPYIRGAEFRSASRDKRSEI